MIDMGNILVNKAEQKIKNLEKSIEKENNKYRKEQLENKLLLLNKKANPQKFYYGGGTYVKPKK